MLYTLSRLTYGTLALALVYLAWTLVRAGLDGTADAEVPHGALLAYADAVAFTLAACLVAYQTTATAR